MTSQVGSERRHTRATPVPSPVEQRVVTVVSAHQEISDEQRQRIAVWLKDNGIQPSRVSSGHPITIESNVRGDRESGHIIAFTEYYEDENGDRVLNQKTRNEALIYQRWVAQKVPLAADPSWEGWDSRRASLDADSKAAAG